MLGRFWKVRGKRWEGGNERLSKIVHKHGCALGHGGYGIFLDLRVGREDSFGEALDHGSGEREVLICLTLAKVLGIGIWVKEGRERCRRVVNGGRRAGGRDGGKTNVLRC